MRHEIRQPSKDDVIIGSNEYVSDGAGIAMGCYALAQALDNIAKAISELAEAQKGKE